MDWFPTDRWTHSILTSRPQWLAVSIKEMLQQQIAALLSKIPFDLLSTFTLEEVVAPRGFPKSI